ncbi:putative receptor-like protein kinase At5g39000 isoform X2 [Andrographis paniculata]|nr:putative receptor-like protein kinase At5g39000 isoform X2 [Andrographis paniculata]
MATSSSQPLPSILIVLLLLNLADVSGSGSDDRISINCGSASPSASLTRREWLGDVYSSFSSSPVTLKGNSYRTSARSVQPIDPVPYSSARISTSQFSYNFRLNSGQKYVRLHFNPTPYKFSSGIFNKLVDCFSVEAGPFTLLSNFSASITARSLGLNVVTKEFCVNVKENIPFSLVFTPAMAENPSKEFYAFINGIEIISVPSGLSYCHDEDVGVEVVGQKSVIYVDSSTALEMAHRVNVKRDFASSMVDDDSFGMFRMWPSNKVSYRTWNVSVDVGFRYMIRLHFDQLALKMAENGTKDFMILINGMIAVTNADLVQEREGKGVLWYKNCMVMVNGNKLEGRRAILISLHSRDEAVDGIGGPLEGFEIFKLSNHDNSLASPNPLPLTADSIPITSRNLLATLGPMNSILAVVVVLTCLVSIFVHKVQQSRGVSLPEEEDKPLTRSERLCLRFSLAVMKTATDNFFDGFVIGKGGFGKVYKGNIDNGKLAVAIKRLKSSSKQGKQEFQTEIELLSELRHVNVVSLVGYCSEDREMILVYEYIPCGSLADHLYKLARKNIATSLSWKQRLEICIGAGRGLDYLHTGHGIIHRDIKSSNILLDEKFVPKVSDFGLAKIRTGQSNGSTNFKGTFGYFDPDYFRTRRLTMKSDTYSFGVMLLEVLCGRPALQPSAEVEERSLTMWARDKIEKGDIDQIIDPNLRDEISSASLKAFLRIVERCLQDEPKKRPAIAHVVINLEFALELHENANSSEPNKVAVVADVLPIVKSSSSNEIENISVFPEEVNERPSLPEELEHGEDAAKFTVILEKEKAPSFLTRLITREKRTTQQKLTSSNMKNASSPLKNVVKTTMRKLSRLWPRDAIQKSGNQYKKLAVEMSSVSAPVVNMKPRLETSSEGRKAVKFSQSPNLRAFSYAQLRDITRNFHPDTILGEGGYGKVYRGLLKDYGTDSAAAVAIKKVNPTGMQGMKEWLSEVRFLGSISHPNVVKLLGYCLEGKYQLLIYEYLSNGSLDNILFPRRATPLPWDVRLKILIGAANGLAYLHSLETGVIYRDFKPSNILLDESYNAKLSDFGLAKWAPNAINSHVSTQVIGTYGYAAPEYIATGHLRVKSDIYGFGVVLLEILTGLRTIDLNRPQGQQNLVEWMVPLLIHRKKLMRCMDHRLEGKYPAKSAFEVARLAKTCLEPDPKNRPSAQEVLEALERIQLMHTQ